MTIASGLRRYQARILLSLGWNIRDFPGETFTVMLPRQAGKNEVSAALVAGLLEGDSLTASFRRKDPADNGFYGTILGKVAGDKVEGSVAASRGNAGLVRTGKLTLSKK